MQFIYTDTVDVAPDEAIELYVAADLYTMSRLKVAPCGCIAWGRWHIVLPWMCVCVCVCMRLCGCVCVCGQQTLCEAIVRKGITVDNAALLLLTADSLPHGCTMLDLCLRCVCVSSRGTPVVHAPVRR